MGGLPAHLWAADTINMQRSIRYRLGRSSSRPWSAVRQPGRITARHNQWLSRRANPCIAHRHIRDQENASPA